MSYNFETNWWELTDQIRLWGELGLYGLFAFSQLLSMFGLLPELNFTVMMWTSCFIALLHIV